MFDRRNFNILHGCAEGFAKNQAKHNKYLEKVMLKIITDFEAPTLEELLQERGVEVNVSEWSKKGSLGELMKASGHTTLADFTADKAIKKFFIKSESPEFIYSVADLSDECVQAELLAGMYGFHFDLMSNELINLKEEGKEVGRVFLNRPFPAFHVQQIGKELRMSSSWVALMLPK